MNAPNIIKRLNQLHMRQDIPEFKAGDTLRVHVRIREGDEVIGQATADERAARR